MIQRALGLIDITRHEDALVAVAEGPLPWVKRIVALCKDEGIDVSLGWGPGCSTGGCTPRAQVMARREDAPKVQMVMQREWLADLRREGTIDEAYAQRLATAWRQGGDDPPCPACGHSGPLVEGCCAECGLRLE